MSRFLFYPHAREIIERLPDFYKKSYLQRFNPNSKLSYFEDLGDSFIKASNNALYPKANFEASPNVIFPAESQRALWGGEGIVTGFIEIKRSRTRVPKTWGPDLRQHLFYSEILDHWLMIIVSLSALKQIESMKGLDNYLLKTPDNEINSRLGMHIKREILLKLSEPGFRERNPIIACKFGQFIIPREEAEWIGLSLDEAIKKQMKTEYLQRRALASLPKKKVLAQKLIKQLDAGKEFQVNSSDLSSSSLRSRLNRLLYGEKAD